LLNIAKLNPVLTPNSLRHIHTLSWSGRSTRTNNGQTQPFRRWNDNRSISPYYERQKKRSLSEVRRTNEKPL